MTTSNNNVTSKSSLSTLQALQNTETQIISRINELQNLLSPSNPSSLSVVKRTQAKVELAQLQKQIKSTSRRASIQNLGSAHIVTKERININKVMEERARREEEIRLLLEKLAIKDIMQLLNRI